MKFILIHKLTFTLREIGNILDTPHTKTIKAYVQDYFTKPQTVSKHKLTQLH